MLNQAIVKFGGLSFKAKWIKIIHLKFFEVDLG